MRRQQTARDDKAFPEGESRTSLLDPRAHRTEEMHVVALAGGVGAARFLRGVVRHLAADRPGSTLTIVGNTADDAQFFGLHISPDLDTVMYTLGGQVDECRGWGRSEESLVVMRELEEYRMQPMWFTLGDRDMATHILRTQLLTAFPLSEVTRALSRRWFADLPIPVTLLPMTDQRVETHVVVHDDEGPRAIHFQEWWVRHRASIPAERFVIVGAESSRPADGVLESIHTADAILMSPSNPVVSIGPILAVPGIREALTTSVAPVIGISPIIGGRPVRGMADACLRALDIEVGADAVAEMYADFLDGWLIDHSDGSLAARIESHRITPFVTNAIMTDADAAEVLAREALTLAADVGS